MKCDTEAHIASQRCSVRAVAINIFNRDPNKYILSTFCVAVGNAVLHDARGPGEPRHVAALSAGLSDPAGGPVHQPGGGRGVPEADLQLRHILRVLQLVPPTGGQGVPPRVEVFKGR